MEPYRPLRLIFFIYDFFRLLVMTRLPDTGGLFPYVFYAIPNGLFTLMSFFLWLRLDAYKPYIPLYLAGKILAVVAGLSWLIFSPVNSEGTDTIIGTVLLLSAGDILTVLGGAVLKKRIRRRPVEGTECV
ncbi:hypothetical protein AGMMS49940_16160 [Spirochaetia bacterium]|nr:hypothetical protein AGMMS49940_16160 [Spirochaetia bacterium]